MTLPACLTFDNSGDLYVANFGNDTIEKLGTNGVGVVFASTPEPTGMAFDKNGDLYVANQGNNTILKFGTNGVATLFANTGLNIPADIAFDSGGNLYVANAGDGTIEKFDSSGNGSVFASGLSGPVGIAIQVPEPSSWILVAVGVCAFLGTSTKAVGSRH